MSLPRSNRSYEPSAFRLKPVSTTVDMKPSDDSMMTTRWSMTERSQTDIIIIIIMRNKSPSTCRSDYRKLPPLNCEAAILRLCALINGAFPHPPLFSD